MPDPGVVPATTERLLRSLDIELMTTLNGKERTSEDWKKVFTKASPELTMKSAVVPSGSSLCLMELGLED